MSRSRFITYDEITVEIQARHDLIPMNSKEALLYCRALRKEMGEIVSITIPEHIKKHIKIKVS